VETAIRALMSAATLRLSFCIESKSVISLVARGQQWRVHGYGGNVVL
jgi:hypothetical protein